MTINTKTGEIGFAANEGDLGSYAQWWKPRHEDLVEFAEDALFWAYRFAATSFLAAQATREEYRLKSEVLS